MSEKTNSLKIGESATTIPNKWLIRVLLFLAIGSPWVKGLVIPEKSSEGAKSAVVKNDFDNRKILSELDAIEKHLDRLDLRVDKVVELMAERAAK